uniref:V-SNARE coiled-coil homology domain-containing protein n=2 Tax=Meloidogyne javanica TaxID=6303 RepID=A0A915N1T5_MELJA
MDPPPNNQANTNRKIEHVQRQVQDVTSVMSENMTRIMDRGGRLDSLEQQSDALQESAHTFTQTGQQLRRTMWLRNLKWTIIFVAILVILFIMGVFIILHMLKVI